MRNIIIFFLLSFFYSNFSQAYQNIKILEKIDLTLESNPEIALKSLNNYNNSICTVSFVKQGNLIPTESSFSLNSNLNELYTFLRKYKKTVSIKCYKYKYKTKSAYNEFIDTEINLIFSICKNEVTSIEIYAHLMNLIYGKNPNILEEWVNVFRLFSNNEPKIEKKIDDKTNDIVERIVWKDTKMFNNSMTEINFTIIKRNQYSKSKPDSGLNSIRVHLTDLIKYSRCYLN
jgi:hypothetical protein|tara:strand:- start:9 stop:701 length:693 start_codon:yes stop_codon:yes gene_type:complete